jgi:chaperone required for assembly of F1-ATPase
MRDIFEEIFEPPAGNPMDAARRAMRPVLRKRFYRDVTIGEGGQDGIPVQLDGKPVRTPSRRPFTAPVAELARALADEWAAQTEAVDPAGMPLTRLANAIIDGVAPAPEPVRAEIERYLASDLLFYRASGPETLLARQAQHWDPVLDWAREALGVRFAIVAGVVHVAQPAEALAAATAAVPTGTRGASDAWRLGALNVVTTLTGSALLALALAAGRLDAEAVWTAAHVDEDFNMAQWGSDPLALDRRAFQRADFDAASAVLKALRA